MNGPKPPTLADITVAEDLFRADFEIADRYQAFSAELVRLALLGIAGYGFLLSNLAVREGQRAGFFRAVAEFRELLGAGVICLGVAAAAAVAHRYFSTDALSHQVTILRLLRRAEQAERTDEERARAEARLERERRWLRSDLRLCRHLLVLSSCMLVLGAVAVVANFAAVLFSTPGAAAPR